MTQLIGGVWQPGEGEPLSSVDPATGEQIWEGVTASAADTAAAVAAAHEALASWRATSVADRLDVLEAFSAAVARESDDLASLISAEVGKPLWEAKTEVAAVAAKVGHSLRAYEERSGVRVSESEGVTTATRHKPHGVMAVFGPYNFPMHLPNGHIIPALLAGNTVVFKPSELTPASGERMVQLWDDIGLPGGVLNLIQGGRPTGEALAAGAIDGLLFTGSAATGAALHRQFAGRPEVMLALEMGGNNPLIVIEGAPVDGAVSLIVQSAFITSGQRCTCARRLFIPSGSYGDELLDAVVDAAARLRVGDPADPNVFMGPVISDAAAGRLVAAEQELVDLGAQRLLHMEHVDGLTPAFLTPGVLEASGVELPDEEHFGPLLTVARYGDVDEAVQWANATRFGLAAGVLGGDRSTYERLWEQLDAGIVNWNRPTTGASSAAPFGGIGASGNHRPAAYYAADYTAYPVASLETEVPVPDVLPGQ